LIARLVALAGLWIFCIYSELHRAPDLLEVAAATLFFGWIAMIDLRLLRATGDRIAVDASGIWYLPAHGPIELILWDSIQMVKAHEVARYLEITEVRGPSKIKVEYGLDKFDTLKQVITQHRI
jgi:hypothetical protein